MSKVRVLRALVKQRLTAAAEDIFGLFERTIAEYEETLCRSQEENERQRRLLDAVFNPQLRLHRADVQQLLVITEEVPPEQQDWSCSLDQEDPPEPPHIKEEQEEVWTNQEGEPPLIKEEQEERWTNEEAEQLQGLQEEADITKFTLTPVPVKSEEEDDDDDEEKPQASQLHRRQPEQMETEADGEDCRGPEPEPARNSDPDTHLTPDTEDQTEDGFDPENDGRFNSCEKRLSCSVCSKQFNKTSNLKTHMRTHTGEKPFSCSVCGKRFAQKPHLQKHFRSHTGEKPFSCSICGKRFAQNGHLQNHFRCHTGEKPFSCSLCDKCFSRYEHLQLHMRTHTGEKPVSCNLCEKRFTWPCQLRTHNCVGNPSGFNSCKKILNCSVCGRQFNKTSNLKRHMRTHLNRWKQRVMDRTVDNQDPPETEIQIGFSDTDELKTHSLDSC